MVKVNGEYLNKEQFVKWFKKLLTETKEIHKGIEEINKK